jgi:hypothetical protein
MQLMVLQARQWVDANPQTARLLIAAASVLTSAEEPSHDRAAAKGASQVLPGSWLAPHEH